MVFDKNLISEGDLTVLGKLAAGDITAIGTISNGHLEINGFNDSMAYPSATITTCGGPLHLQHDGANNLETMASKVSLTLCSPWFPDYSL
nr:hypothetical protein [Candidatus Woesebacteria bacterium]